MQQHSQLPPQINPSFVHQNSGSYVVSMISPNGMTYIQPIGTSTPTGHNQMGSIPLLNTTQIINPQTMRVIPTPGTRTPILSGYHTPKFIQPQPHIVQPHIGQQQQPPFAQNLIMGQPLQYMPTLGSQHSNMTNSSNQLQNKFPQLPRQNIVKTSDSEENDELTSASSHPNNENNDDEEEEEEEEDLGKMIPNIRGESEQKIQEEKKLANRLLEETTKNLDMSNKKPNENVFNQISKKKLDTNSKYRLFVHFSPLFY